MNRRELLKSGFWLASGLLAGCSGNRRKQTGEVFDSATRQLPGGLPHVSFTDVTQQAGIDFVHSSGDRTHQLPEDMGSGAAWGDYDNDGYPDLYLVNQPGPWGSRPAADGPISRLYHNNGDGTFADVTERAGVANRGGFGMGAAWGDYDNDGLLDLYVTNYGRSILYHNNGDGTFTDVTDRAGVANERWAATPLWFDYDGDGYLDLYVANYLDYRLDRQEARSSSQWSGVNVPLALNPSAFAPVGNRLYHNNRDGTFTDVATKLGVADAEGRTLTANFSDFGFKGYPDLFIANDISSNRLYQNAGKGRFVDISASSWIVDNRSTMAVAIGDFDGDGANDMFHTHWVGEGYALYQNLLMQQGAGDLHFADTADMYGCGSIGMPFAGWGTFFFDFDNDGSPDILVVNGSSLEQPANSKLLVPQRPLLLWSKGRKGYFDLAGPGTAGNALRRAIVGRGAAFADYDRDGDLDVIITTNHGRPMLLRNDGGNRNQWLAVQLRGERSNRQGIGAKLWLKSGEKSFYREYGVQGSYLSYSSPEAWFGLGSSGTADSLTIQWPSGTRQVLRDLPVNQLLRFTENSPAREKIAVGSLHSSTLNS
jgi:enediyne biosynthesis protein E4